MWPDVRRDFARLLSSQIFPVLTSDFAYLRFLRDGGVLNFEDYLETPSGSGTGVSGHNIRRINPAVQKAQNDFYNSVPVGIRDVPDQSISHLSSSSRRQFSDAAALWADITVRHIVAQNCLEESSANPQVITGPFTLYRVWDITQNPKDGTVRRGETGPWWFSQDLLNTAIRESYVKKVAVRDWLRDALAISLDFSKCDQLSRIDLIPSDVLPVITANGLRMPHRNQIIRRPDGSSSGIADDEYWKSKGKFFEGQKTQYFLPFVPPDRIHPMTF